MTPSVQVLSYSGATTAEWLSVMVIVGSSGTVTLTSGNYASAATVLSGGNATIVIPAGALPIGTDTITATYVPDAASSTIYASGSGSESVTISVPPPPSFNVFGSTVSIFPGSATGNTSTITLTPSNGFTGSVTLSASVTASPTGAQYPPTLSFGSTSQVSITGTTAGTATLTISTTAATSSSLSYPSRPDAPWYATGGSTLACLLLLGLPARRRRLRTIFGLLMFLVALTAGMSACGGGGNGGGGGGGIAGTTVGTYTITVTGTSGDTTEKGSFILTVK